MGDAAHDLSGANFVETATRKRIVVASLFLVDLLMLTAATLGATYLRFNTLAANAGFENIGVQFSYYEVAEIAVLISLFFLWRHGLYDLERLFWGSGEYSRVVTAIALGMVAFILATYALRMPGLSRAWMILSFALSIALVSLGRAVVRYVLHTARRSGRFLRRTLVVGTNQEAAQIIRLLKSAPETGLVPIGCLASSQTDVLNLDFCGGDVPCLGEAAELATIVRERQIDTVLIASSAFEHSAVSRMLGELRGYAITTHVSSGLFEILTRRVLVRELAGVPLITVRSVSLSRGNLAAKRIFDIGAASLGVLVGLPVWAALALGIKMESRGPVFYRQERVGRDGKTFGMFKFRSMCHDAEARLAELKHVNEATGPLFKMKNDPRVTRIGAWMRKFSIDEFPQLINVLRGEMSLVGPRPPLPGETVQYTPEHWRRMEVPPGMTGLWQVSGRSSLTFEEMVRLDLYYIENWSVGFDMSLIMRTVPAVLFAKGAY
ncbi:MAG: sugar transferase [Actinomycetota bacterium]|nr:sugar transferase [Actinomycetota bacterium]MDP3630547.1 sugar transferase [Actinomycetota bacterium]